MGMKLIEDALACPTCSARLSVPGLQRCNSCGMEPCLETGDTKRADEQIRLLLSRDAVLREIAPREIGGSRW